MFTRPITKIDKQDEVFSDNRIILHVDLNSFFATAEQQVNPYLRGKPVGILKAAGRTCVIAASVEAKKRGVTTGTDIFNARKLCPEIILVPANFDRYADITYRFIRICQSYSPTTEVFSLDECFIDVTETEKFWGHAFNIAFEIKDRLRTEVGDWMSCSVGISHNRMLAKLASSQIKPDGLFWITEDNVTAVLDKSELTDICGLGPGLSHRLIGLGIDSFPKLRACSLPYLTRYFGAHWAVHLYNVARGIDYSPVVPAQDIPDAKSVGRTYTTHRDLTSKDEVAQLIRNLCEEAAAKARRMNLAGRYVGLSLRGGDKNYFGHQTLSSYIDSGKTFFDICMRIASDWPIAKVRFCGVFLGMMTKSNYLTSPLFPKERREIKIDKTVDEVNAKYGDYTLFPAQLLGMPIVRPEVNGYFGDKSYRLKFANFYGN